MPALLYGVRFDEQRRSPEFHGPTVTDKFV